MGCTESKSNFQELMENNKQNKKHTTEELKNEFINLFEILSPTEKEIYYQEMKGYFEDPLAIKSSRLVAKLLKMYDNELDVWFTVDERGPKNLLQHLYLEMVNPFTPSYQALFFMNLEKEKLQQINDSFKDYKLIKQNVSDNEVFLVETYKREINGKEHDLVEMRICKKIDDKNYEEFGVALAKTNLTQIKKFKELQDKASTEFILELRGRKFNLDNQDRYQYKAFEIYSDKTEQNSLEIQENRKEYIENYADNLMLYMTEFLLSNYGNKELLWYTNNEDVLKSIFVDNFKILNEKKFQKELLTEIGQEQYQKIVDAFQKQGKDDKFVQSISDRMHGVIRDNEEEVEKEVSLSESLNNIKENVQEGLHTASQRISEMGQEVLEKTSEFGHQVKETINSENLNKVLKTTNEKSEEVRKTMNEYKDKVDEKLIETKNYVEEKMSNVNEATMEKEKELKEKMEEEIDQMQEKAEEKKEELEQKIEEKKEEVKEDVENKKEEIQEDVEKQGEALKEEIDNKVEDIKNDGEGLKKDAEDKVEEEKKRLEEELKQKQEEADKQLEQEKKEIDEQLKEQQETAEKEKENVEEKMEEQKEIVKDKLQQNEEILDENLAQENSIGKKEIIGKDPVAENEVIQNNVEESQQPQVDDISKELSEQRHIIEDKIEEDLKRIEEMKQDISDSLKPVEQENQDIKKEEVVVEPVNETEMQIVPVDESERQVVPVENVENIPDLEQVAQENENKIEQQVIEDQTQKVDNIQNDTQDTTVSSEDVEDLPQKIEDQAQNIQQVFDNNQETFQKKTEETKEVIE